jgi:hypothetical protein
MPGIEKEPGNRQEHEESETNEYSNEPHLSAPETPTRHSVFGSRERGDFLGPC